MDRLMANPAEHTRIENDPNLRDAAEWFLELRSDDVSVERIAEWQEWLLADTAHREAFDRIDAFWRVSERIEFPSWPSDREVAADRYEGDESISAARTRPRTLTFALRKPLVAALAAGFAAVAVLVSWLTLQAPQVEIATQVGETRSLSLPDGSTVAVGGHSAIEARFAERSREIALEQGEAFFHVAKDAARPFIVHAGPTSITAVGTAFNVRRTATDVTVAVAEGSVRIRSANAQELILAAGQQARVDDQAATHAAVLPVDTGSIAGWRDGRLQYMNESLGTVIDDIARYSSRRILIPDARVRELRITGIVFQQNVDGWLTSLESTLPIEVLRDRDGAVMIEARFGEAPLPPPTP